MAPRKHFDPSKYKCKSKGQKGGGQFASKGGSSSSISEESWESAGSGDLEVAQLVTDEIEIVISKADGENGDFIIGYGKPGSDGNDNRYSPDEFTTMSAAKTYAAEHIDDFIAKLQKKTKQKRAAGEQLPYYD